ncbi:MAG: SufS family cysteine desulfurase [Bacteroidales bacterium]|nr:SufS family cysteine desulfurase [Candidatus Hennigimonas equi]
MRTQQFIELFPILGGTEVNGRPLVYLDNAATSQRPAAVVDRMSQMCLHGNANIHRAVHALSSIATDAYEESRDAARRFLNAASKEEIIFTSGTTAAINLVAYSFAERYVQAGDEIIVGEAEHHSNFVPWQLAAKRKGARVVYLPMGDDGLYDLSELDSLISASTKLVCIGHASNVLGIVNPVKEFVSVCHAYGVPVLVDGAQGAAHQTVDVQDMDCDFYAFSAHKLFGPTGVGVLYGKRKYLEEMPPFLSGGEMVGTVSLEHTDFAALPYRFEAGTQNFNSVAALKTALELSSSVHADKELLAEFEATKVWLYNALTAIPELTMYGTVGDVPMECKLPVFSFTVEGAHHEDIAILLDKMGVAVRSGQMCAEPLMNHFGVTGMVRASLMPYNTLQEAEYFVECLERAIRMLK